MKFITKFKSPNFNKRKASSKIKFIIIHYTAMENNIEAIKRLCNKLSKVSAHFLISKKGDIYNLVNVNSRAWHAGVSYWQNHQDINSTSIGIELDYQNIRIDYKYSKLQLDSLEKLLVLLKKKFEIKSDNILGHSDVSPYRKKDPGKNFPWLKFSKKDILFFPLKINKNQSNYIDNMLKKMSLNTQKKRAIFMLKEIGYDVSLAQKNNYYFKKLIKAYQSRYRSLIIDGLLDELTFKIIKRHYNHLLTI